MKADLQRSQREGSDTNRNKKILRHTSVCHSRRLFLVIGIE
jgi:hypothetical protein